MPTIDDVAAKAKVSTATVSRALNGKSSVGPELVERVRKAADELGYQPNGPARNLRRKTTATLSLIVPDVSDPFFASVSRGFEDAARAAGYSVVLCNTDDDPNKERHYLDVARQECFAGVVMCAAAAATQLDNLTGPTTPVITLDGAREAHDRDRVLLDSKAAAERAAAHLISQGYQRLACVIEPAGHSDTGRLAGYQQAHRAAGRSDGQVVVCRADGGPSDPYAVLTALLADAAPPDALLVAQHEFAAGALRAIAERGLRLGADIGVVVFDDAPWLSLLRPAVSVVSRPAYAIGTTAARRVLARLAAESDCVEDTALRADLVVRGSSIRVP